jgi:DNA-binding NarL/FixJ family response regulator
MHCPNCGYDDKSLTPREAQIEELLVKGKLRKQIADELGVTHATVDHHTIRLFRKREVRSAVELTYKYFLRRERDGALTEANGK